MKKLVVVIQSRIGFLGPVLSTSVFVSVTWLVLIRRVALGQSMAKAGVIQDSFLATLVDQAFGGLPPAIAHHPCMDCNEHTMDVHIATKARLVTRI